MSTINEPDVLTQVPDELKKLAKLIIRGFYTVEHVLVIDFLVRNQIMKEDDMSELLKFEKKQLRLLLNQLKNDKIIKQTVRVETQPDGRTNRHNYYFINYRVFVNIVKYKLDKMRLKIESEERNSTCKALFSCPGCQKVYNDFDAMDLLDPDTGEMKCTHCDTLVHEDESNAPSTGRLQIADFVHQVEPLYELLQQVEDIKLAPEILEPTPAVGGVGKARLNMGRKPGEWSNNTSAGITYNQSLTIEVGEDTSKKQVAKPKEMPVWLAKSTVDGAITEQASELAASSNELKSPTKSHNSEEIMKTLLAHEKKGSGALATTFPADNGSDNESDKSASDDEFTTDAAFGTKMNERIDSQPVDMISDDEDEDEEMMVTVNGKPMPFQDVTDDLLHQMTPSEKENYIELGRRAYEAMYE